MRWKCALVFSAVLLSSSLAHAQDVRIGVLGIFHPRQLTLTSRDGDPIVVTAAGHTLFLQPKSRAGSLQIRASDGALLVGFAGQEIRAKEIRAAGRNQNAADFVLTVPGKIERRYQGTLNVRIEDGVLVPIVSMDLETAVASVVHAESLAGAPLEALKAQAVVTRSYFVAGAGRHADFDFCDLTHCQALREPPRRGSPAALAVAATRDLVIIFDDKPVAAMFTRSCGGRTLTPADIGIPSRGYPYFPVACAICHKDPARWTRQVSPNDAAILSNHQESSRLSVDRRLGWNAVPSNSFEAHENGTGVILEGVGQGHGVGLCQRGARAMAEDGASFRQIIDHYFPNTALRAVPRRASYQNLTVLPNGLLDIRDSNNIRRSISVIDGGFH